MINKQWLCFIKDSKTKELINNISGNNTIQLIDGGVDHAINYLQQNQPIDKIILEIDDSKTIIAKLVILSELCVENTRLICIGKDNDVELYRQLIKLSVEDYYTMPIDNNVLTSIINNSSIQGNSDNINHYNLAIVGTRGGLGASTIASNMGWILANDIKASTCLIDTDMFCGTQALMFNQQSNQGLSQALNNAERLDMVFLNRLAISLHKNLDLLCAEHELEAELPLSTGNINNLLNILKQNFKYSILDINYHSPWLSTYIASTTHVYLALELSISSIRETKRIMELIKIKSPFAKIILLCLRNNSLKSSEITPAQFEESLDVNIDYYIPSHKIDAMASNNLGKILAVYKPNNLIISKLKSVISETLPENFSKETSSSLLSKISFWKK